MTKSFADMWAAAAPALLPQLEPGWQVMPEGLVRVPLGPVLERVTLARGRYGNFRIWCSVHLLSVPLLVPSVVPHLAERVGERRPGPRVWPVFRSMTDARATVRDLGDPLAQSMGEFFSYHRGLNAYLYLLRRVVAPQGHELDARKLETLACALVLAGSVDEARIHLVEAMQVVNDDWSERVGLDAADDDFLAHMTRDRDRFIARCTELSAAIDDSSAAGQALLAAREHEVANDLGLGHLVS